MLLGSAAGRSLHRMAGVAMVLGISVIGLGSPAAGHAAHPPPGPFPTRPPVTPALTPAPAPAKSPPPAESPSASAVPWAGPAATPARTPTITLEFDDGTDDHFGVAKFLGRQKLPAVFYVNSGRLGNPKFLTLDQVRQIQRYGHEVGGHTVFHLRLSEQDMAEQKRAVCVDRNQLLAAGIQATSFAYPFSDLGRSTASVAAACGYQSARMTDGIGCPGCPAAESAQTGDRFRSRAFSGFGPETTAHELQLAVERTLGSDGWLQMVFHRICTTTSCDADSVRAAEFVKFAGWLAGQRDAGAVRTATVRQVLNARTLPGVTPPRATATAGVFQNNSFEQPGPVGDASPRCFTYGGLVVQDAPTWRRVPDARRGKVALRAVITRASAGSRILTTQDLGSCAPPIRAGAHYRVGFWYKATQPIRTTTYARRLLGGYRAFGSATVFPASRTWSLASWTIGPTPATGTALSMAISLNAAGVYTFDDFAISSVAERLAQRTTAVAANAARDKAARDKAARVRAARAERRRPVGQGAAVNPTRTPVAAFVPPDLTPQLPEADRQPAGNDLTGPPAWLGYGEIAGAILLTFAAVVVLDRRFRHLHRRTRLKVPSERRSGLAS